MLFLDMIMICWFVQHTNYFELKLNSCHVMYLLSTALPWLTREMEDLHFCTFGDSNIINLAPRTDAAKGPRPRERQSRTKTNAFTTQKPEKFENCLGGTRFCVKQCRDRVLTERRTQHWWRRPANAGRIWAQTKNWNLTLKHNTSKNC